MKNPTKFVRLWLSDKPTPVIAREMQISPASVYAQAVKLRAAGVNLPARNAHQVPRARSLNVQALNQLIEEIK